MAGGICEDETGQRPSIAVMTNPKLWLRTDRYEYIISRHFAPKGRGVVTECCSIAYRKMVNPRQQVHKKQHQKQTDRCWGHIQTIDELNWGVQR